MLTTLRERGVPDLLYQTPADLQQAVAFLDGMPRELDRVREEQPAAVEEPWFHTRYAAALGQKHAALEKMGKGETPEADKVRAEAKAHIEQARKTGASLVFLQLLMDPNHPSKAGQPPSEREDDLEGLYGRPGFRELLAPWPAPGA